MIFTIGHLVDGLDLDSNLEFGAFLFWVVLRSKGGCFFSFLGGSKGLGSNEGGSFFFSFCE